MTHVLKFICNCDCSNLYGNNNKQQTLGLIMQITHASLVLWFFQLNHLDVGLEKIYKTIKLVINH